MYREVRNRPNEVTPIPLIARPRGVKLVAILDQDWPDPGFEEGEYFGVSGGRLGGRRDPQSGKSQDEGEGEADEAGRDLAERSSDEESVGGTIIRRSRRAGPGGIPGHSSAAFLK